MPILSETEFIIDKWLVNVPEYTVQFVRVILLLTLVESYSSSLMYLLLATGRIKKYQILVGGIQIMNFPIAYVLLKLGFSPISTVASTILIAVICLFTRLILLRNMLHFPIKEFIKKVILRTLPIFILCIILIIPIKNIIELDDWSRFIVNVTIIESICVGLIFTFGLTKEERKFILSYVKKIKR